MHALTWLRTLLGCCLILSLGSCRLGPAYTPPETETPSGWKNGTFGDTSVPCLNFWWEIFEDDTLNCLEDQAIVNNPSLFVAIERVEEARALACVKRADFYPQVVLNPNYSNQGILFKFFAPPGITGVTIRSPFFRIHQLEYNLPLNMSYEVDLWGKIRGQYEYAFATAEARMEAFCSALLTLTTDLASSYFQLRSLDAQLVLLQATIDALEKEYEIVKSRFEKGLVSNLDVANASLQLTNTKAEYEDTARQRGIQENAIAVLIGVPASDFSLAHHPLEGEPPQIPPGTPASVLMQRPDLAEAERKRAAAHAMIGVAYAAFLPSLQLTGALGYSSPDISQFLSWNSRYWAMGATSNLSVFDAGRNCANLEAAWADFLQEDGNYQQTVLTAFQEVEDALKSLEHQEKQAFWLAESVQASKTALILTKNRYDKGLVNYLDVVTTETNNLNAEQNFINIQGLRFLSTVQLVKAIGGSWSCCCGE